MPYPSRLCALFLVLLGSVGCGPSKCEVSGNVTADGEPVEKGEILFETADRSAGPFGCQIRDGAYHISIQPGNYIIRINGIKVFPLPPGQKTFTGETMERRQFLPPRYNAESKETLEIKQSMTHDFKLESK